MNKVKALIFMLGLLVLAACGGNDVAVVEPDTAGAIDIASLPLNIDVQTAASLMDRDDVVLIDVREQSEYDEGHIPGITLIPMSEIQQRVSEIPTDKTVILTCRSGNRSSQVFDWLKEGGYDNILNMQGGILAWEKAGLAVEK